MHNICVKNKYPFRVGTTSYIWPDELLANVKKLASCVDDIELVLFESDEHGTNLPDESMICELQAIAQDNQLSYTVHLPLDLHLAGENEIRRKSLRKARQIIEKMLFLQPYAFIIHLEDGSTAQKEGSSAISLWHDQTISSLEEIISWRIDPRLICIENLESYRPELLERILASIPVNICLDIGHLWLQGEDPIRYLQQYSSRIRVLHIHGIGERDHQSLDKVPSARLDAIVYWLKNAFRGVVTLEVFGVADFYSSLAALELSCVRVCS